MKRLAFATLGVLAPLFVVPASFASDTQGWKNSTASLPTIVARRGQPEPGDDRGNHGAGHPVKTEAPMTLARRGQPEPGDDRGNHGAGHPVKTEAPMTLARRGQPEPGDDRGNHGAGHPVKPLSVDAATA